MNNTYKYLSSRLAGAFALQVTVLTSLLGTEGDGHESSGFLTLEEMLVTGTTLYSEQINALKTPTRIIDIPQSLSIMTADQMAIQGVGSIGDVIDYVPGVSNSQGEGHRDSVVFRGVRSTADFFVDGVRDDVQYYRPLYNVEQLEILRGPNALLFGRGGSGGVLNRVLKKGVIGADFTDYSVSVDTFGAFGGQLDNNIAINDKAALRTNLYYESWDNHRDFFDGDLYGVNPTLRLQLSEKTTLDLSYEYLNQDHFIDRGIPVGSNGEPVEALQDIVFGDPELNFSILEAHTVGAALQHKFSEMMKGNLTAFYGNYDKTYSNFYVEQYDQANPGQVTLDGYVDNTLRDNLVLSGNLVSEFDTAGVSHTLILGAEYIGTQSDQNRFNPVWPGPNNGGRPDWQIFSVMRPLQLFNGSGIDFLGNPVSSTFSALNDDTRVEIDTFSAYVQDEIAIGDKLDIVLGGRFDSFDYAVNDVKNSDFVTREDQILTPRVGIILKPFEAISIYGSYSETFLPASGEQYSDLNDPSLSPDRYENLEAGVKWDIKPGLSMTASVFQIEVTEPQSTDNDPTTLDVVDYEINGFEAQLQGALSDKWYIAAGYSYLEGELSDRKGPTGNRLQELPEHMFSVWNTYRATDKLGLGLGRIYQDESSTNNNNNVDKLPNYARLDGAVFYDVKDNLRVQLNVENITDELYFPHAHSAQEISVGAPINARLTISGRF